RETATLGMWVFIATEIMLFGGLFLAYVVYRHAYADAFLEASRLLKTRLASINTGVLLTSSLTMAWAVRAADTRRTRPIALLLLVTAGLGLVFLGLKGLEYAADVRDHLVPGAAFAHRGAGARGLQVFFLLYYLMTGLHALH